MPAESWQQNFNLMRGLRKELHDKYGFHVTEEMHTKHFLTDKNPYRSYNWSKEVKQEIIKAFTLTIAAMDLKIANVIDDTFVKRVMATLKNSGRLNLKANESNQYGLVIYPK